MSWQDKLTTRNAIALGTVGTFLYVVNQVVSNANAVIEAVSNTEPAVAGAAGIIVGAFVVVTKDVYSFFFRKNKTG